MDRPPHWRSRVQDIYKVCQEEIKRTTEIGKKMLGASKTNSSLHDHYEELGIMAVQAIREGKLQWEDGRVGQLLESITKCEQDLESIESEVNEIRFSGEGPTENKDTSNNS